MTRALVVGSGGLTGAYSAGVLSELCRQLGPNYFDTIYASSVGVFSATFFVANQARTIEETWRHLVDGKKLVNFSNPLFGRQIMDLEYLIHSFQTDLSWLDVSAVFDSSTQLVYVATDYSSGKPRYIRPTPKNIFSAMTASCAIPVAHTPVEIEGELFVDGALSDSLPIALALNNNYDQVVVVTNKPKGVSVGRFHFLSKLLSKLLPVHVRSMVSTHEFRTREVEKLLSQEDKKLLVIRPSRNLPLRHLLDTRKKSIDDTLNVGIEDACIAMNQISSG